MTAPTVTDIVARATALFEDLSFSAAREWKLPAAYVRGLQRQSPSAWRGRHPAETGTIA